MSTIESVGRGQLYVRRLTALRETLVSVDKFTQAELLFQWRTDVIAERYPNPRDPERMSVEALKARDNDEQWKSAVADCQYHAQRGQLFAAVHATVLAELRLLENG